MRRRQLTKNRSLKLTPWDMQRANIGEKHWGASLSTIPELGENGNPLTYVGFLRAWIANIQENIAKGYGLILCGPFGSGKSCISVVLAKEVIGREGTALKIAARDLVSLAINDPVFDPDFTWMARAREVDLLLMDDLGAEHTTEFSKATIEKVIRERLESCRSLVVSTNLNSEQLMNHVGKGAFEAMTEFMHPIVISGVDWRGKAKASISEHMQSYWNRSDEDDAA